MAYVPVPKDLSKVKTKVAFNLTKRQLICFAAALGVGLPLFFLLKDSAGTSLAAMAMIVVMLPCFLFAMYEKHGQPLGENLIPIQRGLTTSSTAIFIPFITQELFQTGEALYYGLNALSNNMILCDRKQLKNPNGLILGTPGSGKSFAAKREMTNAFLITDDDIIICDPEAEYFSLVQRLNGQVVRLSPAGKGMDGKPQYVNPMDINLNYSEDDNPLALKSDFILSLCELVIGGKEGLQPVDKTVIDRAVRNVYRPFLADPDPAKMPILGDLYDELLKQSESEAARIAAALELYVSGSLNVFNHRTNVELSNRLVCFDIKQLGKQLKKLGIRKIWAMITVMSFTMGRRREALILIRA